MESKVDTLEELVPEQIEALCDFYKQHQDDAPHIFSFLQTTIAWQKKQRNAEHKYIQVFAPNGKWEPDGTFVSIMNIHIQSIFLYTMDPLCGRLVEALDQTNRMDFKNTLFFAIHEKQKPFIDKLLIAKGLKKIYQEDTHVWRLDREEALGHKSAFSLSSDEFCLARLKLEDSTTINEHWPFKNDKSIVYVRTLIEMNGGYGIYTRDEQKLVAWVLKSQLGQLALLQVLDGYQRKGLAGIVTLKMAQEIANDGHSVIGTVLTSNTPSQKLFAKLGFVRTNICSYFAYA